ncbi:hypothetical protein [Streptomyces sp. 142MFCol3.1]|uniref:hypothetical protein n=1 Tax=Streptomyces sp. 142MFCol3.1 TaxID=1172179 RepID=UPI000426999C|nr:hypothetical protein [Streptomyces sp. 142MFCol3.1]
MSKRQIRKMLQLMSGGEPVQLTSGMASVKKLARLAFVAQQFGYEYADVRQGSGRNNALTMLIVPDHSPQAQARAAQNRAQFPKAADGESLPPVVPDALELLKARINFDLTGRHAEKRMLYGAVGATVGCVVLGVRAGGDSVAFTVAGALWALLMVVLGIGLVVTRKRNAKFAARLQSAGFIPVTEEGGRVRYLPPAPYAAQAAAGAGAWAGAGSGPYAQAPGASYAPQPGTLYTPQPGTPYVPQPGTPHAPQSGTPYAPQPGTPYVPQPGAPYAPQSGTPYTQPQTPGPYGSPHPATAPPYQAPGAQPPTPYAQPQPHPQPSHSQAPQPPSPYAQPQAPGAQPPSPYANPQPPGAQPPNPYAQSQTPEPPQAPQPPGGQPPQV